MAQETQSQATTLAGTLDDAGNIGHDKRLLSTIGHDAQVGLQRREGIVGNFGLGSADDAQQGGFARIGKAHQTDVGQQFQLQDDSLFNAFLARLGKTRCLACRRLEMLVAQAAAAATQQAHDLTILGHVTQELPRLGIIHRCATRHLDGAVLTVLTRHLVFTTRLTVGSEHMALKLQMDEGPQVAVSLQVDVTATTAVAAVRTALGDILGTVQMRRAGTALTTAAQYLHIVNKIALCHNFQYFDAKIVHFFQ